jgi:hypothetical protein
MNNFRTISISLLSACLFLLVIGTAFAQNYTWGIDESQLDSVDFCLELNDSGHDRSTVLDCFKEVAARTNDPTVCENEWEGVPVDRDELDECYLALGAANNNIDVCRSIANVFSESECIAHVAGGTKDIGLCDEVTRNYADCYISVGIALQDTQVCTDQWEDEYQCIYSVDTESSECITQSLCTFAIENSFRDVLTSHRNYEAIYSIYLAGIVEGYSDGTYQPDRVLNRAELLKIIVESAHASEAPFETYDKSGCFTDVTEGEWYTRYACYAKELGIVEGYSDGSFRPAQEINFVEALKISLVAFGYEYLEGENNWYDNILNQATELNLTPADVYVPGQFFTRGQMAEMITRIFDADPFTGTQDVPRPIDHVVIADFDQDHETADEKYDDEWMSISSYVSEIEQGTGPDYSVIFSEDENSSVAISCEFDRDSFDEGLDVDYYVFVTGQYSGYDEAQQTISLSSCDLVIYGPRR